MHNSLAFNFCRLGAASRRNLRQPSLRGVLQGRVSRHKKIKAVDPFSRTHGVVDVLGGKVYDLAPKARDIDRMPTKLRMMHRKPESKEKKLPTRMFKVRAVHALNTAASPENLLYL